MGNKWERTYKPPAFNPDNWLQGTLRHPAKPQHGAYRLLVNTLTSQQLQEHCLQFDTLPDFQRYLDFFSWREREDYIVNAKFMNYEQGRQICGSSFRARVYIQHIPVRLSDIQDIPYPENLYVLLSALEGFEKLHTAIGSFPISEDLVCMDKDGRVKAWLNADLSRCTTVGEERESKNRVKDRGEERMVEEIIQMVEANTAEDTGVGMTVTNFIKLNYRGKGLTFKQAKQEILHYADRYQAEIPNYFESVIGIFQQKPSQNQSFTQPHFNTQPLREGIENRSQSNHVSSYKEKVTGAVQMDTLNRIPSYEQMQRMDEQRTSSPVFHLGAQTAATEPISVNRSSYQVSFKYPGTQPKVIPPVNPVPFSHSSVPPPVQAPFSSLSKAKSATLLKRQSTHQQESVGMRNMTSTSSLRNLLTNNKLLYSDCSTTYVLDAELTEDLIKLSIF